MMGDFPAPDAASLSGSQIARSTAEDVDKALGK